MREAREQEKNKRRAKTQPPEGHNGRTSALGPGSMLGVCRYFVGPYVGIASGLCRYCVGTMSDRMSGITGCMSGITDCMSDMVSLELGLGRGRLTKLP